LKDFYQSTGKATTDFLTGAGTIGAINVGLSGNGAGLAFGLR
jgi:hypothetical protein